MPIKRQESLFGIQDLFDLEPTQRFEVVSTIDMDSAVLAVSKKSWLGAPTEPTFGNWNEEPIYSSVHHEFRQPE